MQQRPELRIPRRALLIQIELPDEECSSVLEYRGARNAVVRGCLSQLGGRRPARAPKASVRAAVIVLIKSSIQNIEAFNRKYMYGASGLGELPPVQYCEPLPTVCGRISRK